MSHVSKLKQIIPEFLQLAESYSKDIEPVKILKTNTFTIGASNVLIRFASDIGRRYFFGLSYITIEELFNLDNSLIAFICGSLNQIIFFPVETLVELLPRLSHDRNGEYKINFTKEFELVLSGRGNRHVCDNYLNNWSILSSNMTNQTVGDPTESIHSLIQGRLIEMGNLRGFHTYSPDKRRQFNRMRLDELTKLQSCPYLQFTDFDLLRYIDVLWFRKTNGDFYPEFAFEVEISTGVWSGYTRLSTLREFNTKLYIVTHDSKRFNQAQQTYPDMKERYLCLEPDRIGLLYSAEKNLIAMRRCFKL